MTCTDCGAKHSDANGTICPKCGRKHKIGVFDITDEQKKDTELARLLCEEVNYQTENFDDLRNKWRDNPRALEIIDGMEKSWHGDGIGSKKNQKGVAIMLTVCAVLLALWGLNWFIKFIRMIFE